LRLFREIDGYEDFDKRTAKKILKKLVKNVRERKDIEKEV
jgi:hypothetical protein